MPNLEVVMTVAAAIAAAGMGILLGRARGVDQVARRADTELGKLVTALTARAELLERENQELRDRVAVLEKRIEELEHDLDRKSTRLNSSHT